MHYCHCFRKSLCEMKKNMTNTGSHTYTYIQRDLHTCTHTGRYRRTVPPKRSPNQSSYWFYQSVILSEVPHNCPTPHLPFSCCTKAPSLSSFRYILRQGRRAPCRRAFEALSAHCQPAWKCGFSTVQRKGPGLVINPNAFSREMTIPKPTEQLGFSGYRYRK